MGLKLSRLEGYDYKSKTYSKYFKQGEIYFNIPVDVEKYLLKLGYFHYVPEENKPTPKNVEMADKHYSIRENGKPEEELYTDDTVTTKKPIERPMEQVLDIMEDASGKPVLKQSTKKTLESKIKSSRKGISTLGDFVNSHTQNFKVNRK